MSCPIAAAIGSIRQIQLEGADRAGVPGELEWDIDLEQLSVGLVRLVLLLPEVRELGGHFAVKGFPEFRVAGESLADQVVIV